MKKLICSLLILVSSNTFAMRPTFSTSIGGGRGHVTIHMGHGRPGRMISPSEAAAIHRERERLAAEARAKAAAEAAEKKQIEQFKADSAAREAKDKAQLPEMQTLLTTSKVKAVENKEDKGSLLERMKKKVQSAPIAEMMCFPGETLVSVSAHYAQPISTIKIGDFVVTCNVSTQGGECEFGQVKKVMTRTADKLVKLTYGDKTLRATENHPFWVVEKDDFVQAQDIILGDHFLDIGGKEVVLDGKEIEEAEGTLVYNLEVEGSQYYACDVLVHNCTVAAGVAERIPAVLSGAMPFAIPVPSMEEIRGMSDRFQPKGTPIQTVDPDDTIIERIPRTDGTWSGVPGESEWTSTNEAVKKVTEGKPVPFKDQYPDFSQWVQKRYEFDNLTGDNSKDFALADKKLAQEKGWPTQQAAKDYRKDKELTWHHHQDGKTLELVPSDLHKKIPHDGGASELRDKKQ